MELPFAGLHQLCAPMLERLDALPAPQRDALSVALGSRRRGVAGAVPGRPGGAEPAVARSPRSVRCCASSRTRSGSTPPRAQVLGFVARRLLAESVAIVVAVREPVADGGTSTGCPSCGSSGLPSRGRTRAAGERRPGPARRAASATGSSPRPGATRWRCSSCRGRMTAAELAGGFELPGAGELCRAHRGPATCERLGELPEATRRLLLLAAAEPLGDAALSVARGASGSASSPTRWRRAEPRSCWTIGERVRFRHPLVRSAVYRSRRAPDRRACTWRWRRRASRSATRTAAPGTARWRLPGPTRRSPPSSSAPPAGRRRAAGSPPRRRSSSARVELTPDPAARRADAALAAAQASLQAGAFDAARGLLATARGRAAATSSSARSSTCCARSWRSPPAAAPRRRRCCSAAARRLEPLDVAARPRDLRRRVLGGAVRRSAQRHRRAGRGRRSRAGRAARRTTASRRPPTCCWTRWSPSPTATRRPCRLPGGAASGSRRRRARPGTAALAVAGVRRRARALGRRGARRSCPTAASRSLGRPGR